jgi:hypothetical protein
VDDVLNECDFKGGVPKWSTGAPEKFGEKCQLPVKYQADLNKYRGTDLGACKKYKIETREKRKHLVRTEKTEHNQQFAKEIQEIRALKSAIGNEIGRIGPAAEKFLPLDKFLSDRLLNALNPIMTYTLVFPDQEDVIVDYKWLNVKELQRIKKQMQDLLGVLKKSQVK